MALNFSVITRRAKTDGACREQRRTAIQNRPLGWDMPLCPGGPWIASLHSLGDALPGNPTTLSGRNQPMTAHHPQAACKLAILNGHGYPMATQTER